MSVSTALLARHTRLQVHVFIEPLKRRCVSAHAKGPEMRAKLGIKDNLIRFSTGIEHVDDLWADFSQALDKI